MANFTSAMLFAPVHGGCYIISSMGIKYSCGIHERNVMYSVCLLKVEAIVI